MGISNFLYGKIAGKSGFKISKFKSACPRASQVVLVIKNSPANAGALRDASSVPGSGRPLGGGRGNPLQFSCLMSPMDRGAWQTVVQRVVKSRTRLKRLSMHARTMSKFICTL